MEFETGEFQRMMGHVFKTAYYPGQCQHGLPPQSTFWFPANVQPVECAGVRRSSET